MKEKMNMKHLKSLTIHLVCQCLIFVPLVQAQSEKVEQVIDKEALKREEKYQKNVQHEKLARQNGGLKSYDCNGSQFDTVQGYLDKEEYSDTFISQGLDQIQQRRERANQLTGDLRTAEGIQASSDPIVTKQMQELTAKADAAKVEMDKYREQLNNMPYASPRDGGQDWERRRAVLNKYYAARGEYNSLRRQAAGAEGTINNTINDVTTKQATQIASDAISGCTGSGSTKTCELSGELYEKDKELTEMANANVQEAINLAKRKTDTLLDLELQSQYNGDYKLFESAILMGGDLDLTKLNDEQDIKRTRNIALTISSIKSLALASAAVKDLECVKDSKSEADAKSYHLFRAAAATFLMAQMNDTSLHTNSSSCRATEDYTSDERNLQIRTVERAANISQEQLENICLRVNPQPPTLSPTGEYEWELYGDDKDQADKRVEGLRKLKVECDAYLAKLRGPEYVDKPRTRQAAIDMLVLAQQMALEELNSKREKVAIAHANIQKGKAWIKRVKTYITTMLAMAVALKLAAKFFFSLPFGKGIPKGSKLMKKAMYIIGIVVGIYLVSELARAKAFLKKWEKKMDLAKSFTHLTCNHKKALSEEGAMLRVQKMVLLKILTVR